MIKAAQIVIRIGYTRSALLNDFLTLLASGYKTICET